MASPKVREAAISIWPNPVPLECGVIVCHDKSPGTSNKVAGSNKFTPFVRIAAQPARSTPTLLHVLKSQCLVEWETS